MDSFATFLYFLFACFVTWAVIIGLLVLHEYGHIYAMRRLGMRIDKVVLGMFKVGSLRWRGLTYEFGLAPVLAYCVSKDFEISDTNRRAWVALAGPAATAATGLFFYAAWALTDHWLMRVCVQGSVILFLTNIIPLPPLDGWTVAEHLLAKRGIVLTAQERKRLLVIGAVTIVAIAVVI